MLPLRYHLSFVALASLTILASPVHRALADPPIGQVNVVNPATSPVPTIVLNPATMPALTSSVDNPGRIPYQATINNACVGSTGSCNIGFPFPSGNHRLVIQHVSGFGLFASTPNSVQVFLHINPAVSPSFFFAPFNGGITLFDQPVLAYSDGPDGPSVEVFGGPTITTFTVSLTGYSIDCLVSNCAPIAP
jgi:hypothetical protein